MSSPSWIKDAIFYQIFPDRFYNGKPDNDPPNVQPWGSIPTSWGFQGGDLQGILQKFDYLLDLGITAIYLNPIFQATSTHRYNTTDYFQIDPKLGSLKDFHELINHAHRNQVRIILDGVFNHCGRGFFAFNDILENQEHSPYRDWFHIKKFPVNAYSWGESEDYLGWWNMKSLPKFNTKNLKVWQYLMGVARYWIDQGADGWRLDVPNEINDDEFWLEFRNVVKSANPDAYILGEIWTADQRWVGDGHFDGLMNYPVLEAISGLIAKNTVTVDEFSKKVEGLLSFYPMENVFSMYTLLGSHDTERILTKMENNLQKTKLAYLFLFAFPGAPAIYYGDEIGLTGGKDPGCRGAFQWDPSQWNYSLRDFIKKLIALRKTHEALRRGSYFQLKDSDSPACYIFWRKSEDDVVLVLMNFSDKQQHLKLNIKQCGWENGRLIRDLITPINSYTIDNQMLELILPPWEGIWLA